MYAFCGPRMTVVGELSASAVRYSQPQEGTVSLENEIVVSPAPGTYVLVLRCSSNRTIRVGCLGSIRLRPGYYLYVGSGFGPGGLRARNRAIAADRARALPVPRNELRDRVAIAGLFSRRQSRRTSPSWRYRRTVGHGIWRNESPGTGRSGGFRHAIHRGCTYRDGRGN